MENNQIRQILTEDLKIPLPSDLQKKNKEELKDKKKKKEKKQQQPK
jgi:hypothetical protein